jgi:DNA-directed RNA polymerase specialized sigma24 family protein
MLDVERALARLPTIERDVIEITLLQKRSLERAAFILGRSIRTIVRRRNDALERLAAMPEFRA